MSKFIIQARDVLIKPIASLVLARDLHISQQTYPQKMHCG